MLPKFLIYSRKTRNRLVFDIRCNQKNIKKSLIEMVLAVPQDFILNSLLDSKLSDSLFTTNSFITDNISINVKNTKKFQKLVSIPSWKTDKKAYRKHILINHLLSFSFGRKPISIKISVRLCVLPLSCVSICVIFYIKTAPLFRKTLQNYCFFYKSMGGVHPKFKKVLFFLAESARNAQHNLLDGDG